MRTDQPAMGRGPAHAPSPSPHAPGIAHHAACCADCEAYEGTSHAAVWSQVKADRHAVMPQHRVTLASFFRGLTNRLLSDARRTLSRGDDLLPPFRKLIRPNGICLSGTWRILRDNQYSGYFAGGASGLIIARASVAMSETRAGHHRSFGMAGKIYPTVDPHVTGATANFFVIDDNGGTRLEHYADAEMTNLPRLSLNASSLVAAPLLATIAVTQRLADSNAGTRQLYPVAALGADPSRVSSPRFMMIRGAPGSRRSAVDFRDQLRATAEAPLVFEILVRDRESEPFWPLGEIVFDDHAVSASCDSRLHFAHPPFRKTFP